MPLLEFTCKFGTEKVRITAKPTDANGNPANLKGPLAVNVLGVATFVQLSNESFECISDSINDTVFEVNYPSDPNIAQDQVLVHFIGEDAVASNLFGEIVLK